MLALRAISNVNFKPVLEDGAPTSTSDIVNAAKFCNALSLCLDFKPARLDYRHGWVVNGTDSKSVAASWYLTILNTNKKATTFVFGKVNGKLPLIVGLDVIRCFKTDNILEAFKMFFKRPKDSHVKQFYTYTSNGDSQNPRL